MVAPYYELPGLDQVYLEDSYVLDVLVRPGSVEVFLDVVLREGHPDYAAPNAGDLYCFRPGVLSFDDVTQVHWRMPEGPPAFDASGETDYGGIDEFTVDGSNYRLVGGLGELLVHCTGQSLRLGPVQRVDQR